MLTHELLVHPLGKQEQATMKLILITADTERGGTVEEEGETLRV